MACSKASCRAGVHRGSDLDIHRPSIHLCTSDMTLKPSVLSTPARAHPSSASMRPRVRWLPHPDACPVAEAVTQSLSQSLRQPTSKATRHASSQSVGDKLGRSDWVDATSCSRGRRQCTQLALACMRARSSCICRLRSKRDTALRSACCNKSTNHASSRADIHFHKNQPGSN